MRWPVDEKVRFPVVIVAEATLMLLSVILVNARFVTVAEV
jgi:hypothetical protein